MTVTIENSYKILLIASSKAATFFNYHIVEELLTAGRIKKTIGPPFAVNQLSVSKSNSHKL